MFLCCEKNATPVFHHARVHNNKKEMFRYQPTDYPNVFNEATTIVSAIFENSDVIISICDPIASRFPKENPDVAGYEYQQLVAEVQNSLGMGINVLPDTKTTNIMKLHPNENILHVNRNYFDRPFDAGMQYNRCLLLLINKLIHEIFHALTTTFYILHGHNDLNERDKNGMRKYVMAAPPNLGKSYGKGRALIGDNGFAFEEYFIGGRLVPPLSENLYNDPLLIMVVNKTSLQNYQFFIVNDTMVDTALSWFRAPTANAVNRIQLYDHKDLTTIEYIPRTNKRRDAPTGTSSTDEQPPLKKPVALGGSGILEDIDEEVLKECCLRGHVEEENADGGCEVEFEFESIKD